MDDAGGCLSGEGARVGTIAKTCALQTSQQHPSEVSVFKYVARSLSQPARPQVISSHPKDANIPLSYLVGLDNTRLP